jgi:hypothetical protein
LLLFLFFIVVIGNGVNNIFLLILKDELATMVVRYIFSGSIKAKRGDPG